MSRQLPPSVTITNESTPLLPQHQQSQQQRSRSDRKTEALGLTLMALSALGFSTNALFVKIGGAKFPSLELVFARGIIQGLLGLLGCWYLGLNPLGKHSVRKWLFFRGLTGAIGLALYFYSLTKLPLADATVVFFLSPTFTAIIAALVLKEAFTLFDGICAALCLVGVALISKPTFVYGGLDMSWDRIVAISSALLGAMFAAVAYVTVRKIGKGGHFLQHTTYFGFISAIMSPPLLYMFQDYVAPSGWYDYLILLLTGVTAFIGQCLLNSGLQLAPAGPGTLMRMNDVVFAFLFGILLLHEYPDAYSISGAVLIVSTTTALGVHKWRLSKKHSSSSSSSSTS